MPIYRRTPVKTRERQGFTNVSDAMELPDLIEIQRRSYRWFYNEGIKELFSEITPVNDFIGRDLELYFDDNLEYPATESYQALEPILTPTYIRELPQDPTDGRSYGYSGSAKEFELTAQLEEDDEDYSVFSSY